MSEGNAITAIVQADASSWMSLSTASFSVPYLKSLSYPPTTGKFIGQSGSAPEGGGDDRKRQLCRSSCRAAVIYLSYFITFSLILLSTVHDHPADYIHVS